jgi:UDP-N-acetylmuramoyl-L-alanyl-D-glutamate--2,6-diaminopimelate ligase
VFTSLMVHGYSIEKTIEVMTQLKAAPGRMEIVAQSPYVLVDYAHTPDALENVLTTLQQLKKGDLWVIFGCGGDRDKSKRPIMGHAASLYADKIVVTSDNPRSEDPEQIISEIINGLTQSTAVMKLTNREEAIAYALNHAESDDIILIAGKGHEAYQQIGTLKHLFSDQETVRRLINKEKCI